MTELRFVPSKYMTTHCHPRCNPSPTVSAPWRTSVFQRLFARASPRGTRNASRSSSTVSAATPDFAVRSKRFVFNHFQDASPATLFFSNFCIVARGWYHSLFKLEPALIPSLLPGRRQALPLALRSAVRGGRRRRKSRRGGGCGRGRRAC